MLNVSRFYLFDICTCKCKVSEIETKDRSEKISYNYPKERRILCQGIVLLA